MSDLKNSLIFLDNFIHYSESAAGIFHEHTHTHANNQWENFDNDSE